MLDWHNLANVLKLVSDDKRTNGIYRKRFDDMVKRLEEIEK